MERPKPPTDFDKTKSGAPFSKMTAESLQNDGSDARYPLQIPEAQGDLADRTNIEMEQEAQENIRRSKMYVNPKREHFKEKK